MVEGGAARMSAAGRREIIEGLREEIRRLESRPARRAGFLWSGRPEVDALLPGGGFPRGALADLAGGPASGKTLLALSTLREAIGEGELGAFVDGRGELYPPAAQALGIDLARLLIVLGPKEPAPKVRDRERTVALLWAAEALLASGAFAAVAIDVPARKVAPERLEAMLRRLAAAAEKGGTVGLWLSAPGGCRVPAAVHLELAPAEPGELRLRRVAARGDAPPREAGGIRGGGADHAA
jgi:protein ImuA